MDAKVLIRRYCRQGDEAAFSAFYRDQAQRLWRFLVARSADPEEAYDLVAEAFTRFVQRICDDPRAPVAFLYRIAINLQVDAHRRRRATEPLTEDSGGGLAGPSPEALLGRRILDSLEPDEQNLLLLRYWIGLTHRETAAALGIPEGTVRRRSRELLERLRHRFGDEEQGH